MKVPLSWLKQFVPLTETPQEIANRLTNLGIEVEGILGAQATFRGVVVGRVLSAQKHPKADRLQVATITDGEQEYQVVCGASNCRAGLTVAFARIGAELTEQGGNIWKIKKSKIRDVESHGMLCSYQELQLSDDSEGIIELPQDLPLGANVETFLLDPVFELSLTPNLGHCQSILGIARELAASFNLPLRPPMTNNEVKGSLAYTAVIENPTNCYRFASRLVTEVKIGPSPTWLQARLAQCGIRSINNLVDISNYVMLELGHPIHLFDTHKIEGSKLYIKQLEAPAKLETLDGISRKLDPGALVVSDEKRILSIAGILGGAHSSVSNTTQSVLIEAAAFRPELIRKTSRSLDLKTEASSRFDKGIDSDVIPYVIERTTELILQLAGGVAHPISDENKTSSELTKITCRPSYVQKILGFHLSAGEMIDLLKRLHLKIENQKEDLFTITIPRYRNDLQLEVDIVEEIARLYGYSNIPFKTPLYSEGSLLDHPLFTFEKKIRSFLIESGLQECITCDLISPEEARLCEEKMLSSSNFIQVLHPRSQDQSVLRPSLLSGLLKVAYHNFNHQERNLSLFEIGRIHFKLEDHIEEPTCAGILLTGHKHPFYFDQKIALFDFFDLKGIIENLFKYLHLKNPEFQISHLKTLHPWRQAQVILDGCVVGVIGELHPNLVHETRTEGRLLFAELNIQDLLQFYKVGPRFSVLPTYPFSYRDWTVSVPQHLTYAQMCHFIEQSKTPHLESYEFIDSFNKSEIENGIKNITFRFIYLDREQTITTELVDKEHRQITHSVAEKLANFV